MIIINGQRISDRNERNAAKDQAKMGETLTIMGNTRDANNLRQWGTRNGIKITQRTIDARQDVVEITLNA